MLLNIEYLVTKKKPQPTADKKTVSSFFLFSFSHVNKDVAVRIFFLFVHDIARKAENLKKIYHLNIIRTVSSHIFRLEKIPAP